MTKSIFEPELRRMAETRNAGIDPIYSGRGLQLSQGTLTVPALAYSFKSVNAAQLSAGGDIEALATEYMARVRAHLEAQARVGLAAQKRRLIDFQRVTIEDLIEAARRALGERG
jgi:hypothetical protein